MEQPQQRRRRPTIPEVVREASKALARLDAGRLEELVLSCAALNRELPGRNIKEGDAWADEAREASSEMAVFGRVLEATRANLAVMNRLRELTGNRLEYRLQAAERWTGTERGHGDH